MKLNEILNEWSEDMSYAQRKRLFDKYCTKVEEILGYDIPYEKRDIVKKAFLRGQLPDEAADVLDTGAENDDRFTTDLDSEDMAYMHSIAPDADNADVYGSDADLDDFSQYTDPRSARR